MWLDDCRIPFVDGGWGIRKNSKNEKKHNDYGHNKIDQLQNSQGRFTPNLLVCDDMLNDGSVSKKTTPKITQVGIGRGVIGNHDGRKKITKAKEGMEMLRSVGDKGTNSRYYDLDLWFDKMLEKL